MGKGNSPAGKGNGGGGDNIDNMIDNFGTLNKNNVRRAQSPGPGSPSSTPVTPKFVPAPKQVPLKQAMDTFNNANKFLDRYKAQPVGKPVAAPKPAPAPKAPAMPKTGVPMPKAGMGVRKAGRGK